MTLAFCMSRCWFINIVPEYLNFVTFSKDLLTISMVQFCLEFCSWDLKHILSFLSIYRIPGQTPYYRTVSLKQLHIFLYSSHDLTQSSNTNSIHQKHMCPILFPILLIFLDSVTVKLQSIGNIASHSFIPQCTQNAPNTCTPFQNSLHGSLDAFQLTALVSCVYLSESVTQNCSSDQLQAFLKSRESWHLWSFWTSDIPENSWQYTNFYSFPSWNYYVRFWSDMNNTLIVWNQTNINCIYFLTCTRTST